jgi:hypothetical protein
MAALNHAERYNPTSSKSPPANMKDMKALGESHLDQAMDGAHAADRRAFWRWLSLGVLLWCVPGGMIMFHEQWSAASAFLFPTIEGQLTLECAVLLLALVGVVHSLRCSYKLSRRMSRRRTAMLVWPRATSL